MIRECAVWRGKFLATYEDEVSAWASAALGEGSESVRLDLEAIRLDSDALTHTLSDDGYWLCQHKVVVLDHVEAYRSDDVKALLALLASHETEYSLALVLRSGAPVKAVTAAATEEVRVRDVPKSGSDLARWARDFLAERDVRVDRRTSERLAEHVGEENGTAVQVVTTLASYHRGRSADWSDVLPLLPAAGAVRLYELTGVIAKGEKEAALEVVERLLTEYAPLQVLSMITKRYRSYLLLVDGGLGPDEAAALVGGSPGAARHAIAEARRLGSSRALLSFRLVADADAAMKGGSALDAATVLSLLVVRLTQHFHLAGRS